MYLKLRNSGEDQHDDGGQEEQGADTDQNLGCGGGVWILCQLPDAVPKTSTAHTFERILLHSDKVKNYRTTFTFCHQPHLPCLFHDPQLEEAKMLFVKYRRNKVLKISLKYL